MIHICKTTMTAPSKVRVNIDERLVITAINEYHNPVVLFDDILRCPRTREKMLNRIVDGIINECKTMNPTAEVIVHTVTKRVEYPSYSHVIIID